MAEPVMRDPASPEPNRRPGPQPVRAASAEVPAPKVPAIDPSHELPPPAAAETAASRATTSRNTTGSAPAPPTRTTHPRTPARPPRARTSSQEMIEELRRRLEELRDRVEKQTGELSASLKRELTQDADYVKIRARYYHERRPLQALGMVAAAGFAFGVFVGLWRR